MATDLATLVIKCQTDGVSQAQSGLDGLTRSGANAERSVGTLTTATGGLVSALAKIAAAVGGVYAIQRAFTAGIKAVDDFRVSVIGIAATLTDMAKSGQGSMETVFARNKAAAEDMYKAITVEAAKHFSSASEGMMVYNRLVQSGYSVQKSEVSDLLLLTDKIKLSTKGQNVEMQLNTEIIALMAGQAKAQSMIAMELQSRLGSGWGELVKKHREAGDLLKWISSLFPGLVTANKEIEGTLNAQWATTKSLLDLLSIGGLAGAYNDIVNILKGINERLKDSEGLVNAIARAWEGVRDIAKATWHLVSDIYSIVSKAVTWSIKISTSIIGPAANFLAGGAGPQGDFGFGAMAPETEMSATNKAQWNQEAADRAAAYKAETFRMFAKDQGPAQAAPRTAMGAGGAGGGGGGGGADSIQKEIEKINKEVDKARKDAMAAESEAFMMIWKLKQDTAEMYATATKGQYEIKGFYKSSYDTLASISPVMGDQIGYQKKALDLEEDIEKYNLKTKLAKLGINKAQEDELLQLQALTAQYKKYNAEMESNKGLQGWAYARVKSDSQKNNWAGFMDGAETFITDVFSQGIQGALSKTKVDFMEVAKTMAQSLVLNLAKQGIHKAFGGLAELITGGGPGKLGTKTNPMWVAFGGMGGGGIGKATGAGAAFDRSVEKAGKVGYTMGHGKDEFSFTDQYKQMNVFDKAFDKNFKDWNKEWKTLDKTGDASWKGFGMGLKTYSKGMDGIIDQNQEAFKTDYITGYQDSFTGMAMGITGIWGTTQGLMTAAGVSGEAARYGTMVSYGIQGITLLYDIAAKGTLAKAWTAGASAYSSVWEWLGFPAAVAVAPVMAAIAFAGTMAAGAKSSAGGDYQVGMTGPRYVHQDETILPAWAAQSWRDIVSRGDMSGGRPGENGKTGGGDVHFHPGAITIDARGADKNIDWEKVVRKQIAPELKRLMGNKVNG